MKPNKTSDMHKKVTCYWQGHACIVGLVTANCPLSIIVYGVHDPLLHGESPVKMLACIEVYYAEKQMNSERENWS